MIKITHEEAKGYVESIETDGKLYSFECKGLMLYINQQEKQEKLLELYKKLAVEYMYLANYLNVANQNKIREYQSKVFNIKEQIKELEDETNNI